MDSIVKLYRGVALLEGDNKIIEDIDVYLDSIGGWQFDNFQYLKPAKKLDIKVSVPQEFASLNLSYFDYATIQNGDGDKFYYFIDRLEWLGEETIRVKMSLDALNTYSRRVIRDGKTQFGPKTEVIREHRNRYALDALGNPYPIVDRVQEGMGYPLVKVAEEDIIDNDGGDVDWSLSYVSNGTDQGNPISVVAYPTRSGLAFNREIFSGYSVLHARDNFGYSSREGDCIYILASENADVDQIEIWERESGTGNHWGNHWKYGTYDGVECVCLGYRFYRKDVAYWYIDALLYRRDLSFYKLERLTEIAPLGTYNFRLDNVHKIRMVRFPNYDNNSLNAIHGYPEEPLESVTGTTSTSVEGIASSDAIDRTDSTIKKIVSLPYRVFDYSINRLLITFSNDVFIEDGRILLSGGLDLKTAIKYSPSSFIQSFLKCDYSNADGIPYDLKRETKRLNSEFTSLKFVYDSFSYTLKIENNRSWRYNTEYSIDYEFSSSMQNEMLFKIGWKNRIDSIDDQDFERLFVVNRSNETALFTSAYLDYIRNGYNYDLKRKSREAHNAGLGIAINAINTIVGAVSTIASKGASAPYLTMAVGGLTSAISSTAISEINRQESMAHTLKNAITQGVSIENASDFDIMKAYNRNRAQLMVYHIDSAYRDSALNRMRLFGYASSGFYNPRSDTRRYFNFVQCKADISTLASIPVEYLQELKSRFEEGVTIFHHVSDSWDLAQRFENYEILERRNQ